MKKTYVTPKQMKKGKVARNSGGGSDGPIGHWTQRITRGKPALISENLVRCYFVVKNHGPDPAYLAAQYGDHYDLGVGEVRVTYAYGVIQVQCKGEKSALIEFDLLPLPIKH